ncbi:flagellin [Roseivivax sp. CAU 1753]
MKSIGDLAQSLVQQTRQGFLKSQIDRFGKQLTTGVAADSARKLSGDTSRLNALVMDLARLDTARELTGQAEIRITAQQATLSALDSIWAPRAADMLRADLLVLPDERATMSDRARDALDATLSALNTRSAGRSLFGGTATDRPAMADSTTFMASIEAALVGATDSTEVAARLDAWFDDPGGGYETDGYQGSATTLAPMRLGNDTEISLDLRADDSRLRSGLKALATAIVATSPDLALSPTDQTSLLTDAGLQMIGAQAGLTSLQADLGATEAQIDASSTRISAEIAAANAMRLSLVGTDAFDDASKLEAAQFQLESLYTVTLTARRMSFLEVMR